MIDDSLKGIRDFVERQCRESPVEVLWIIRIVFRLQAVALSAGDESNQLL